MRNKFITLEGIDGAGKSTHLLWLADWLRQRGLTVCVTREPGGTELGEKLRQLLLDKNQGMHAETEALLMCAARREHLDKVIAPALARGEWVLCDRFSDATFAYQGGGSGVSWSKLESLENWVQGTLRPDLTILFDVDPELGKKRAGGIKSPDRFEQEQLEFFRRVRAAYLRRAQEAPQRLRIVDANLSLAEVQGELLRIASTLCQ